MNQIDQIIETLDKRGESDTYIVEYLRDIIKGLQAVAPKPVKGYLDVTIHNMTPVKNSCDTYDQYGVNTKNSFNTPPKK